MPNLWLCGSQWTVENSERDGNTRSLTCLLRNLYAGQEATVRPGHGTTDWFQIGKGVHQGCILSPCLFNFYSEYIIFHSLLWSTQSKNLVNEADINVFFLEFPYFFYDPTNVGNLISGSSAFSKPSLYIWKFLVHILLKPSLKDFEDKLTKMQNWWQPKRSRRD